MSAPVVEPASRPAARIVLAIWLGFATLIALASLLLWLGLAFISLLSHPTNDREVSMWIFLVFFYSYPFWMIGLYVIAWFAYARKKNWVAWLLSTVTMAPLIYFAFYFFGGA
jgi:hypothetical protein